MGSPVLNEALMRLLAAQVPALARRAVQVPTKMLATIEADQVAGASSVRTMVDGAPEPIDVLNATGRVLALGQRVVVDFYPPHGAVVSGVLAPAVGLEQVFTYDLDVNSSASVGTTTNDEWAEATAGGGWEANSSGDLVCRFAGLWLPALQAEWDTSGDGTHRVAALLDQDGTHRARTSHQFNDPGGTPTTGYRLSGAGFGVPYQAVVGDTLTGAARQDSGADLGVALYAHLRLLGV